MRRDARVSGKAHASPTEPNRVDDAPFPCVSIPTRARGRDETSEGIKTANVRPSVAVSSRAVDVRRTRNDARADGAPAAVGFDAFAFASVGVGVAGRVRRARAKRRKKKNDNRAFGSRPLDRDASAPGDARGRGRGRRPKRRRSTGADVSDRQFDFIWFTWVFYGLNTIGTGTYIPVRV